MALIKCTGCGQMISDRASICPRCGCPVNNEQQVPQNSNMVPPPTYYYNDNRRNNNIWPYVVIAVLLVALVGGGFYFYDKNKQQELALQKKLIIDSIAKDSIAKAEKAQQESIEQSRVTAEKKKQQTEQKAISQAPQFYGQVSDPDGYTNIRRGPSTSYPIVRRYDSGDYLYYTPQGNGWSLVYSGDKANTFMGYMHTSRIVRVDPNRSDSYGYSGDSYRKGYIVDPVDDYVNIRKGPGMNYAIVGRLDTYTDVYYTSTGSNWYKVYDMNKNYLGYVYYNRVK